MRRIDKYLLDEYSTKAKSSPRKRVNYNFHEYLDDTLQRMLNCLEPETYVRPHKHQDPDKREAFVLLRGRAIVFVFDDRGGIIDHVLLDNGAGMHGVEIPAGEWHSLAALDPDTVVYEVKDGPYSPINDKNFATWAPAEDEAGCQEYLSKCLHEVGIHRNCNNNRIG
jgi:cupin fold WbuC family metalloprotein